MFFCRVAKTEQLKGNNLSACVRKVKYECASGCHTALALGISKSKYMCACVCFRFQVDTQNMLGETSALMLALKILTYSLYVILIEEEGVETYNMNIVFWKDQRRDERRKGTF